MRKPGLLGIVLAIACCAPPLATAAAHDYRFDLVHTQILFSVSHLRFSHPVGRMHVKAGFIHFDDDDWSTAQVDAVIDTASVDMGDAAWNDKLRSHEFFQVGRYPTAHFVSTRVEKTGAAQGIAHGKLTLLGVTRPIDLVIAFNRAGLHAYSLKFVAGFSATTKLKRSDFGMSKYLPDVGDDIDIRIEAEGLRDKDARDEAERAADPSRPDSTEH